MPKEHNPGSRFQLRGIGDLQHPACCAVCGSGVCEFGYLDIGVYYDYEGQVYLCMTCFEEGAEAAGLLSRSEAGYLQAVNTDLAAENAKLKESLEAVNERIKHYDALFGDRFNEHPDLGASVTESKDESTDGEPVKRFVPRRAAEQPVITESVESEGSSDVTRTEFSNTSGINL